jgi:beta-glucosidase-like glycosyl hydrolase
MSFAMRRPETMRERAGQCVMARIGSNLPPATSVGADANRVRRLLERCPLGGLILFRGAHPAAAEVLADLQRVSRFPLLVGADIERGVGQQVRGGTVFPHAQALGATDRPEEAAALLARATAREARACGIHWAFAPVADVNTCAENPIIGIRAFGEDAPRVSGCVRAYVRAARDEGLLTTAKHFPGHGRTAVDSHETTPVVDADHDALDRIDLPPFQAAIDAGVDAVMTAHVAYPALDPEARPATGSPPILRDRLRREMGFDGVVVSDSLLMEGGPGRERPPGEQAAALLNAGVDLLLDPDDPEAVVDGLVAAVANGSLAASRLNAAWQRVWRLKVRLREQWGDAAFAPVPGDLEADAHRSAADALARQAVRVHATPDAAWPLPPSRVERGGTLHVVALTPRADTDALGPYAEALRATYPAVRYDALSAERASAQYDAVRAAALDAEHLVLVGAVEPAAWHAFGLRREQQAWMRRLAASRAVVVAALGSPHMLQAAPDAPDASVHLCTYSTVPASQRALVACMAGRDAPPRVPPL